MFKKNFLGGYRFLHCNTVAGGEGGAGAGAGNQDGVNADELLKSLNLNLPAEKIEALKKDPEMLKVLEHQVKAKREANQEAKANREKLEAIEKDRKAKEDEALAKKGEYETLYKKSADELSAKDKKIREVVIQKDVGLIAAQLGIKKTSYLKLLDTADLEVDLDSLTAKDAEKIVKKFKEENPDFFGEVKKIDVHSGKPKTGGEIPDDDELKKLEETAKRTRLPRDIAAWQKAKQERDSKK